MADKTGYTRALDSTGAPILQTFVDNGDGTYAQKVSGASGGGGGAATIADGADVTQGAIADAAVTAGATGSISAKLRSISRDLVANIVLAAGSNRIGKVTIRNAANGADIDPLSESDFDTKVGGLTETAPASDTASSGLNGRLQRIAQRLTSLIALITQGAQALAASQAVNDTSATLYAGTAALSTTAAAIASTQAVREVLVQNDPDNSVDIFVGNNSAQPIQLRPGASLILPVSDLATVFAKSASGTPTLNYLGRS